MTFRKLGLSVAMTAFALLASLSAAESAQARHSYGGHHGGHHGHHSGGQHGHKQKYCPKGSGNQPHICYFR